MTDHTEASTDAHPNSTEGGDSAAWPNASDHLPVPVAVLVGIALVAGVVGRFVVDSPLWLDEALSVNIASLPLGDIPAALKLDGHPPLYYYLLHGWMEVFGDGDAAVRAFSGVWAVALIPLMWVAGRRLGGKLGGTLALAVLALSPYAVRYGTETRMYSMVAVFALGGWLLVDDAVRRPTWMRLGSVTVVTALLLWTHYWSLWLLTVAGLSVLVHGWRARRAGDDSGVAASVRVAGAFVIGGLLFVPWVPTMLYQSAHTGTPWARPVRPTEMVAFTVTDFGGGPFPETALLGMLLLVLAMVGVFGMASGQHRIELDLRVRRQARPFVVLIAGTLTLACVVGYATGATYATRYAAVFFPFYVLLVHRGLLQLGTKVALYAALVVLLVLGAVGVGRNVTELRSDSRRNGKAIAARADDDDIVVYCPDQLGPSGSRELPDGLRQVTYPEFAAPERVDWVDYADRLDAADPARFADELITRAGDSRIFLVYSTNYDTHRDICPDLRDAITAHRVPEEITRPTEAWEQASVVVWEP